VSISPRDAWTLARLVAGQSVTADDLQAVSRPFRQIAEHLAARSPEDQSESWREFMDGRDRDSLVNALAAVDLEDPPPEALEEYEPGDGWGPLRVGTLPPAAPFPLDVLPLQARDLAEAAARSIGCPVDFPAVAILAAASGIIGQSASLLVKQGYFESASVYLALVGSPSSGKSPALNTVMAPLRQIGQRLHEEYRKERDAWQKAPEDERGPKPIFRRIITSDPTTETIGRILADNPRGLTYHPDELTKMLMSMDQYKGGRGGDRPFFLSAWGGEAIAIDRAKHADEPIMISHPFLTIVGGMTPSMLGEVSEGKGRDDGFAARFLFAYPDRVARPYSEEGVPEAVASAWQELVDSLWRRPMRDLEGQARPNVVQMSPEARAEWARGCQAHRDEQQADDFSDSLEGAWGKLEAYAARLTLILACLRHASDPTLDPLVTPTVDGLIVHEGWRLVDYFKANAQRVYASLGGKTDDGGSNVRTLRAWIARKILDTFSERDVKRDLRRFRENPGELADTLEWMTAHNLIRLISELPTQPGRRGRKPSTRYETHPRLLQASQNRQNCRIGHLDGRGDPDDCHSVDFDDSARGSEAQ
jgi:hypothetical protein